MPRFFGVALDRKGRNLKAVAHFEDAIDGHTTVEFHEVFPAIPADGQAQPLGQGIHTGHANAVQATGNLVGVLVELAAGVQFGQRNFGGGTLGLVLVVHLDAGGDTPAVVDDADGIVDVNGDGDVVTMAGQGFVDGVVYHFED